MGKSSFGNAEQWRRTISRRQLLAGMAVGGAVLAFKPGQVLERLAGTGPNPSMASIASRKIPQIHVVWVNVALPSNLDPAIGFASDTLQFIRNVYEGLLEYAPGSTVLRPALATSYTVSPDGLTWTFKLRKGVVFQDGSKLDATAVVTSLNRIREINQGPASLLTNVKDFSTAGPSQVVVHLSAPYVFLPGVMPWLPIVSAEALRAHRTSSDPLAQKWFSNHAVGTGPYRLTSFKPTTRINMVRNTHYWQPWRVGTPTSGSMTLNADVTTQLELLQAGRVDFLGAISPTNAETAKSLSNVVLLVQPGLEIQIMPLNMKAPPLDNPKVREALVKAFDYKAFLEFNKGYGKLWNSPVPPGMPDAITVSPAPKQDLGAAKKLFDAAGVKPGTTFEFVGVSGLTYEQFAGTVLQSALAKLGMKLKVQMPVWPGSFTIVKTPRTPVISFLNLSANTNDPSSTIRESWASSQVASKGGYNWSYYENSAIDADLDKFGRTARTVGQKALITRMQKQIVAANSAIFALAPELTEPVGKQWRHSRYDALYDENVIRWFYTQRVDV